MRIAEARQKQQAIAELEEMKAQRRAAQEAHERASRQRMVPMRRKNVSFVGFFWLRFFLCWQTCDVWAGEIFVLTFAVTSISTRFWQLPSSTALWKAGRRTCNGQACNWRLQTTCVQLSHDRLKRFQTGVLMMPIWDISESFDQHFGPRRQLEQQYFSQFKAAALSPSFLGCWDASQIGFCSSKVRGSVFWDQQKTRPKFWAPHFLVSQQVIGGKQLPEPSWEEPLTPASHNLCKNESKGSLEGFLSLGWIPLIKSHGIVLTYKSTAYIRIGFFLSELQALSNNFAKSQVWLRQVVGEDITFWHAPGFKGCGSSAVFRRCKQRSIFFWGNLTTLKG